MQIAEGKLLKRMSVPSIRNFLKAPTDSNSKTIFTIHPSLKMIFDVLKKTPLQQFETGSKGVNIFSDTP